MKESLIQFFNNHKKVYIYGCNEPQRLLGKYFEIEGRNISGFVVSDSQDAYDDVLKIGEIVFQKEEIGIIVAVLDIYYNDIIPNLIKLGFKIEDIYFFDLAERNKICSLFGPCTEYEVEDFVNIKNEYQEYCLNVIEKCKKEYYYMFCIHFSLGDLVQVFQLNKDFEERYNSKLYYFITEKQKIIAEICHLSNYIIIDKNDISKYSIDAKYLYRLNIHMFETIFMNIPIKGVPFVVPFLIKFRNLLNEDVFTKHFSLWLRLDNKKIEAPAILKVSNSLRMKIGKTMLSKIVLLAPEATSIKSPDVHFWTIIANREINEGNTVVVNSFMDSYQIPNTINLNLSLRELLELAGNCLRVYSIRSGFCDCIAGMQGELNVYYWNDNELRYFGLQNNYINCGKRINELLIDSVD